MNQTDDRRSAVLRLVPKPDRRQNHELRALVARGLAVLTEDERQALAFERHRREDPHCTCNDCIAAHAAALEGPTHGQV